MHRLLRLTNIPEAVTITAFFLAAIFVLGMNDFSVGTDVGLHYAFANEVAQLGWPQHACCMAFYPPIAHFLAIAIGALAGSTLKGMFIVTAISFAVTYLALAEFMRRPTAAGTVTTMLAFLLIAIPLRKWRFLEGNELISNFFFAQFAATAALLVSAILLFRSKLPFGRWLVAAALATHVLGWIYTLCAIELALACAAFQALTFLDAPSPRSFATIPTTGLVLCAVAIVHPTIIGSLGIAANDGAISIEARTEVVVFAFLALGTLILIINRYRNDLVNQRAVIALSIGVAAACATQYAALKIFGMGSPYAVKKYGFLLGTLDILVWACLLADVVRRFFAPSFGRLPQSLLSPIAVSTFGVAMLLLLTVGRSKVPVSLEEQYAGDVADLLNRSESQRLDGNTLSWNDRLTPHVNYTVTVGLLHPGAAITDQQHSLLSSDPKLSGAASFVLVDAASGLRYDPSCVVAATAAVAAIHAKCRFPQR